MESRLSSESVREQAIRHWGGWSGPAKGRQLLTKVGIDALALILLAVSVSKSTNGSADSKNGISNIDTNVAFFVVIGDPAAFSTLSQRSLGNGNLRSHPMAVLGETAA